MKLTETQLAQANSGTFAEHPPARQLAQLLEPAVDQQLRETLLSHIETCPSCALEVQQLLSLGADTQGLAEDLSAREAPKQQQRRTWAIPLSVAASLALAIIIVSSVLVRPQQPESIVVRGMAGVSEPSVGATLGRQPDSLSWTAAFNAPVQVALMDATAQTIWQSEFTQTSSVVLPANLELQTGTYFWQLRDRSGTVLAGPFWFEIQ